MPRARPSNTCPAAGVIGEAVLLRDRDRLIGGWAHALRFEAHLVDARALAERGRVGVAARRLRGEVAQLLEAADGMTRLISQASRTPRSLR